MPVRRSTESSPPTTPARNWAAPIRKPSTRH